MCPSFSMPRFITIKRHVEEIFKDIHSYYEIRKNTILPDESYYKLCIRLAEAFNCTPQLMVDSCSELKGQVVTKKTLYNALWRLCANADVLRAGQPVYMYPKLSYDCTEEVQFVSMQREKKRRDMYILKVQVLTGHFAPGMFKVHSSEGGINRILYYCGYHGRSYIPGFIEDCLPGLYAKAQLEFEKENPIQNLLKDTSIEAYNRKYIIRPRDNQMCDRNNNNDCRHCKLTRDVCPASYNEAFLEGDTVND